MPARSIATSSSNNNGANAVLPAPLAIMSEYRPRPSARESPPVFNFSVVIELIIPTPDYHFVNKQTVYIKYMPEMLQIQSNPNLSGFAGDFGSQSEQEPMQPVGHLIMKAASRCDLNCDKCYVYDGPAEDDSWRSQPPFMSERTVEEAARRWAEDLALASSPPLAVEAFHDIIPASTVVNHTIHTNGTRLAPDQRHGREFLETFRKYRIRVGVSLNGGREANHDRVDHVGRETYDGVVGGIRGMTRSNLFGENFAGVLAVVDLDNDPVQTYRDLRAVSNKIDFLWPHGNWVTPPPGLEDEEKRRRAPYGRWQAKVFDEWFDNDRHTVDIRMFDSYLRVLAGGRSTIQSFGGNNDVGGLMVIETDGSYEMVDTLKTVPGQVGKTGLNVYKHTMRQAVGHMQKRADWLGASDLSATCQGCTIVGQCGGGHMIHRYDQKNRLRNPSIYCQDIAFLLSHTYGRVHGEALYKKIQASQGKA